jgi:hypothetical protein
MSGLMLGSEKNSDSVEKSTSTGHNLAGGAYLDAHFNCMQPEYEAMLPSWLRKAGFDLVSYETFHGERRPPLEAAHIEFLSDILSFWGNLAIDLGLPEEELVHWRRGINPEASEYVLNDPDFYVCEAFALVIGQVPEH